MSGQIGVLGDWEPATEACLGRADGFPRNCVRGLVGGIAVQVSTFSPVDEVCKEELVAVGPRASRPGGIVALGCPSPESQAQMSSLWPGLRV